MPDEAAGPVLNGENLDAWSSLATVLEWLPRALDEQLQRDADLTHFEFGMLYALGESPDHTLRMSVLAEYANSLLPRLSRAAARLESKGWLEREPDPTDGRYTLARLTDEGRSKLHEASPGHVDTVHRLVLDPLTATQVRQLTAISRTIIGAMRDTDGWRPPAAEGA